MAQMAELGCGCSDWSPLAKGARNALVELRSNHPALVHVSRSGPSNGQPAFVLTKSNRLVHLTGLSTKDTIYGRAKVKGTEVDLTVMIDRGKTL